MDLISRISQQFSDSAHTKLEAIEMLAAPIAGVENFGEVMILDPRQPLPPPPPAAQGRGGDGGDKTGQRPKKKRPVREN